MEKINESNMSFKETKEFKTEEEYLEELELNQLPATVHINNLEYDGEVTKYGIAILVSDIKKGDFINMYNHPCYITHINSSKKGIWIIGRSLLNHLECDIVFPSHDLAEKLNYKLSNGTIINIIDGYVTIEITKLNEEDKEVLVKCPVPSSKLEHKMFEEITNKYSKQEEIKVEVIDIYDKQRITRIIN